MNEHEQIRSFLVEQSPAWWSTNDGMVGFGDVSEHALDSSPLSPQQVGLHLFETLFQLSDILRQDSVDEEMLDLVIQTLELHLNVSFETEAQLVLFGSSGLFFLNRTSLQMTYLERKFAASWWNLIEEKGLGGFMVMGPTHHAELLKFFSDFLLPGCTPQATAALYPLPKDNASARVASIHQEQLSRSQVQHSVPFSRALEHYAQLLQWVQQRYNPLMPKGPKRLIVRTLKELCALCESNPVRFLGFRADKDDSASYQPYHIANTSILSMLFGSSLGLNRSQCLELAVSALEHEVGKLDLPPELLQKSGPLSEKERMAIEMLPIRTVRRLLDYRFNWGQLKRALIALDVRFRPVETKHNSSPPTESAFARDPSLLFSRIISVCACFDALCAERPFRSAMAPDEALAFMQSTLASQFDPVIMRRFVSFLAPTIRDVTGRDVAYVSAPSERRKLRKQLAPPVIQELQKELKEYRRLKCRLDLSYEEQERIKELRLLFLEKLHKTRSA